MKRLRISLAVVLTMALVLSTAVFAVAAKPSSLGGRGNGKPPVALVENSEPEAETVSLADRVAAIKATLHGNGNAWGRIARELDIEKAPGSIAALVKQLKQLVAAPGEDQKPADELPIITEPVNVTVINIAVDEEGNPTGVITIALPGSDEDDSEEYTFEVSAELLEQLETGTILILSVDENGDLVISIFVEEEQEEVVVDEEESTEDELTDDEPADDTDESTDEGDTTL
ncbi:MAG: hypothetical protein Q8S19_09560 [Bacillota bacterium]|nr:hypothetical protein [Bacillota bacterium]